MNYYSDVFTEGTWQAFLGAGGRVTGFSPSKWLAASRVDPGDLLLCYIRRRFEWAGILRATSRAYESQEPIWGAGAFPVRINVEPVVSLAASRGVHMNDLAGRLTFFPTLGSANWGSHLQGSPRRMHETDGRAIFDAIMARSTEASEYVAADDPGNSERSSHWKVQASLLSLGLDMGCEVWSPKSDRLRVTNLMDSRRILDSLPVVFGGVAQQTVGNIDVLWFRGSTIVAAFEIEHSTSIYSGLLRMADLVAVFPNVSFPAFIVAPEGRRGAVRSEIMRPTFARLEPALSTFCSFISYERLAAFVRDQSPGSLRFLDPKVISTVADSF